MDLGEPLVDYGDVDVVDLIGTMNSLPPEFWASDRASRTKHAGDRPGDAVFFFNDSPAFVTRRTMRESRSGNVNVLRCTDRPLFGEIATLIETAIAPHFPDCAPMRVQLAELPAGQVIPPHRDGSMLALIHRLHVPLVTNPGVKFFVRGRPFELKVGRLYDLNNVAPHSVRNDGDATRVHLMVDMLPRSVARVTYHDSEIAMAAATESG